MLNRVLPKLVRSYALDALEEDETDAGSSVGGLRLVRAALERVGQLAAARQKAVGLGEEVRLKGDDLLGSALLVDAGVIHLGVWSVAYR